MIYDIKKTVFILGWPRTGHTLVRDLLNLHKNIIFLNEGCDILDLFRVKQYLNKHDLFEFINLDSENLSKNRIKPPDKKHIKIIGSTSLKTSLFLNNSLRSKKLFYDFKKYVNLPLCFLICYRNPFDVISSIKLFYSNNSRDTLDKCIDFFEVINENINLIIKVYNHHIIYYDKLINNSKKEMKDIIEFLGLKYNVDYLNKVSSFIIDNKPKRRYNVVWSKKQIERVKLIIENSIFKGCEYEY